MFLDKNYKFILKSYLGFLLIISIYYLASRNSDLTYNAMSEWVINYQGGFVRRGLIGEIVFQISKVFNINLRFSFFVIQSLLYLVFYFLIYDLLKNLKSNYFILLSIFSPIFIIFPIAELEAIGRKEVLIFICLLLSIKLYFKFYSNNLLISFISFIFPILLLTFEASIFYSFYFIFLILLTRHKINLSFFLRLFLFSIPSLVCIYAIYSYPHSPEETVKMCEELKKVGEQCGLATIFLSKSIGFHSSELGWNIFYILRYFFIFVIGFFSLIYLAYNTKFNFSKTDPRVSRNSFIYYLIILMLPTLVMFVIAVDTGRWTHITYTCSFILYFGLLKHKILILNYKLFEIRLSSLKLKNFLYSFFFFLICLSWNPKAVYHEDLGSFPIYRALEKIPNYYNNLFEIKLLR